ncbi:MAG: pentapeptide repeat-containing protein [Pseudomonadota bacterium]
MFEWPIFSWQDFWKQGDANNSEVARNLFFALAGYAGSLFGIFQLYNTARRTRINERDSQTKLEEERNQRFATSAVLLSHEDNSVAMAGIYALERLATEQDAGYSKIVTETLAAFVRDHAALTQEELEINLDREINAPQLTPDSSHDLEISPLAPKIQAAVTALSRIRKSENLSILECEYIDLRRTNLNGLEADNFDLRRWNFAFSNLENADLSNSNLLEAHFYSANLKKADLNHSNLVGADFSFCKLHYTNFSASNMKYTELMHIDTKNTRFDRADMSNSYWSESCLSGATFNCTLLNSADLHEAEDLTQHQLNDAVWSEDLPPKLPSEYEARDFDKSIFYNAHTKKKLILEIFDEDGLYQGYRAKIIKDKNAPST